MYGVTSKKDLYGKTISRWTHEKEKIRKTKSDMSTDSDFEDSKADYSQSFFDKSETQESLSKINTALDDIKSTLKSPLLDNNLEYIKSIDSDTKNIMDYLNKLDQPKDYLTLDQINNLLLPLFNNKSNEDVSTVDIIKHMNQLNNKHKQSQDQILCEVNTLTSNYDYLLSKIDSLVTHQHHLTQIITKLSFDYKHVMNQLVEQNLILNHILSCVEHQHIKNNFVEELNVVLPTPIDNQIDITEMVIDQKEIVIDQPVEIHEEPVTIENNHTIDNELIEIINEQPIVEEQSDDKDEKVDIVEPKSVFKTTPKPNRSIAKNKKK